MNYPIWYLPNMGGSLLIAIIAVFHVVIAHLAVGGGLFLVLTERKALKTGDEGMLAYVKTHTGFFMILSMVFGGVTGVGIWFIIALVNPGGTSLLIHNFVFGWAMEWVFFIAEIVALLIYHYRFGMMSHRNHMIIGWLYFIFAWLSLFIINGILAFMLTPGEWLQTGNFWQGFFNPGFLPGLLFRSAIAFIFAGVFALVTAARQEDSDLRNRLMRYCAKWMYAPLALLVLTGVYYAGIINDDSFRNLFHANPEAKPFINLFIISTALLFLLGLLTIVRLNSTAQKALSFALVLLCFSWMAGFEYMREIARKPWVIYGYMYSNGIRPEEIKTINITGFLASSRWSRIKKVTEGNMLEAGDELFRLQCMACHTVDGYNGVKSKTGRLTETGIEAMLTGMGKINTYMPPFAGTVDEKKALAAFIYRGMQGKKNVPPEKFSAPQLKTKMPPFNPGSDKYVLLVWNDLGMHCISDDEQYFTFLPPANTLNAQLYRRGRTPEAVMEGVELHYEVEPAHANPEKHSMFWKYARIIFGKDIPAGTGLAGKAVKGTMDFKDYRFAAELIPVVPYRDDDIYCPYPVFTVRAVDTKTGKTLAVTKTVAPTSTEMGCRNCHGGPFAYKGVAGISHETSANILAAHDRYNGTTLLNDAERGKPRLCQSCHADPAVGSKGEKGILNFSSAVHGFHANYLSDMDNKSCNMCHPSRTDGSTVCLRGRHARTDMNCTNCHGRIEDHALSLLVGQSEIKQAQVLMANLEPFYEKDKKSINPRTPWLQETDCTGCHNDFDIRRGFTGSSFNKWAEGFDSLYRNRMDNMGVMCIACHGSTHAVYGAVNIYEKHRDNIQPLQYQKMAGTIGTHNNCAVCHMTSMGNSGHHRNMVNREKEAAIVR